MKKFILYGILLFVASQGFAQLSKVNYLTTFDDKTIHFGFTLGTNYLDFNVTNYAVMGDNPNFQPTQWQLDGNNQIINTSSVRSDVSALVPGFTVGIVTSLRLSQDLALRFLPGLSFGERKLVYNVPVYDGNQKGSDIYQYSIKSTFLDFPLLVKYKARRINNDRPYVIFGGAYRQDISRTAKEDLVKLKNGGFYAELGGGWDHYFPYFRLSVEAKFSFGLNDQLGKAPSPQQRQYYTQSIKHLRSKIFTLLFHFE